MKGFFLSLVLLFAFACSSFAQNAIQDALYLKDGSFIKGRIVEVLPGGCVRIELLDGSVLAFLMSNVERIERPASRPRSINPYTTHRKIAAWTRFDLLRRTLSRWRHSYEEIIRPAGVAEEHGNSADVRLPAHPTRRFRFP